MENILVTTFVFVISFVCMMIAFPSSEIISNIKVKNSISSSIVNYYRSAIQVLASSQLVNVSLHLVMLLGFFAIGFSVYQNDLILIMVLLSFMSIICIIKDTLVEQDFLKKDKIINQITVSLLMLVSLKLASIPSLIISIIPILNLWILKTFNSNKNKYQFELSPSQIFIDKCVYYFTLFSQKILVMNNLLSKESILNVVLASSLVFVFEVYVLELVTTTSIISRKPRSKKISGSNAISFLILILLFAKYWKTL